MASVNQQAPILPLEQRTSLPCELFGADILRIFDAMPLSILILDNELRARYYNPVYYEKYHSILHSALKLSDTQILNYKMDSNAADDVSIITLKKVISAKKSLKNQFFQEIQTLYQGFANLHYIDMPGFEGIAVIQNEKKEIEKFSKQLNDYRKLVDQISQLSEEKNTLPLHFRNITGISVPFIKILRQGALVAPTSSSVCIFGESGTGKEVFANALHYSSSYSQGPFIKVNCSAIPETLLESELFGYEKGAFTGANPNGNPGKFELANNGTIFLDEIGELPLPMQVKLLRVLQEQEVTRIGGKKALKLNFRLITATNRNLEQMVKDGTFREDLYYRICIIPLNLPALRERRPDIQILANEFLAEVTIKSPFWKTRRFSEEVLNMFYKYNWPGNIRELKNCVERMAIFSTTEQIEIDVLPANIANAVNSEYTHKNIFQQKDTYDLKAIVDSVEQDTIRMVLDMTGGNKIKAIKMLGISSRTFYAKLEKFGIKK